MASRRTRIKGIATIPQRRKNVEDTAIKLEDNLPKEVSSNVPTVSDISGSLNEVIPKEELTNTSNEITLHETYTKKINTEQCTSHLEKETNNCSTTDNVLETNLIKDLETNSLTDESKVALKVHSNIVLDNTLSEEITTKQITKLPVRRKFIKPTVNIIKKATIEISQDTEEMSNSSSKNLNKALHNKEINQENTIDNLKTPGQHEHITTLSTNPGMEKYINVITVKGEAETTLNEINLAATSIEPNFQSHILEYSPRLSHNINLSTAPTEYEYPPPPPSPSITNRARIKAVPKLSHRKTSFSASESEDETRKSSRMRNDSVCSTTSLNTEAAAIDSGSTQKPREINTIIQKKCNRTEQTRKLAEARREFLRRFGSNAPDRQKLTMMDLIFYNPDTNPLPKGEPKDNPDKVANERIESESVDDPITEKNVEHSDKSDEENDIPVPQIKIGPSGEIILDEKSLVIERKDIKKQREQIAKSKMVDGDFDTGYGIYKKHKRSKFWTTDETLRFYKALNTLGTDFTLMTELFPERTRRELKMKFNKEEKVNRALVDKALMQPCGYDFYVLKEEVEREAELEQKEKAELEQLKLEENKKKKERKEKEIERKRKREREEINPIIDNKPTLPKVPRKPALKRLERKKLNINTVIYDSDADISDIDTHSEDEVISCHKPTRSGRVPKVPNKFDVKDEMVVEKIVKKSKDEIEPGSIMIVTEDGPNGEPIYKIFMITQDQDKIPLEVNSEDENKSLQLKKGITAKNILTISATHTDDEEMTDEVKPIHEINMTIPADETVTTLKSNPCPAPEQVTTNEMFENEYIDTETTQLEKCNKSCQSSEELLENTEIEFGNYIDEVNDMFQIKNITITMRDKTASPVVSFDESLPEENNMTIPADATVTSLRPMNSENAVVVLNESIIIPMENEESSEILNSNKEESADSSSKESSCDMK